MIENLFFDMEGQIKEIANKVFALLGIINNMQEGDSSHVLGGTYYSSSIFGVKIKLEQNSYAYDDKYNYMISIQKDVLCGVEVEAKVIKEVAGIIISLLISNLKILVAYEVGEDDLRVYS